MSEHRADLGAAPLDRFDVLACAIAGLAAFAWFSLSWDVSFELRDQGYLFAQSERVARGAMPHRDVLDLYGPLVLPITGWVLELGGGEILPVRIFLAVLKAGAVALAYLTLRQSASRLAALVGAVLALVWWGRPFLNLNTPYASLYTLPVAQLALLLLLVGERRDSPRWRTASGVAAGVAMLFKQSLGFMLAAAIGLALVADGMLREPAPERPSRAKWLAIALWVAAALLLVVPVWRFVTPFDYALHLLPIHALMAVVALAVARRGASGAPTQILRRRLVPWLAGFAAVWAATLAIFAASGGVDALLYDLFVLPTTLIDYSLRVDLPPPVVATFAAGGVMLIAAVLILIARRGRAGAVCGAALALVGVGLIAGVSPAVLLQSGSLRGVQLASIGWAGVALVAARLLGPRRKPPATAIDGVLIAIVLFHLGLCFQGFPRAGVDLVVGQGPQAVLLVTVLVAAHRAALGSGAGLVRRAAAALLLAAIPVWLAAPVARSTLSAYLVPQRRALEAPRCHGIRIHAATIRSLHLDDFERLEAWLAVERPSDAPLFVLSNEEMIGFASGRPALFEEHRLELFWIGWGLLPESGIGRLDESAMLARLAAHADTLVIDSGDDTAQRVRSALPALAAFVQGEFEERQRFGVYRVLARRPQ